MEFVRMSKKGQLVIPASIRKMLKLHLGDKFIAYGKEDYIVFKKIELPSLRKEFEEIAELTTRIAGEQGITEEDVGEEIKKYRKEKRKAAK